MEPWIEARSHALVVGEMFAGSVLLWPMQGTAYNAQLLRGTRRDGGDPCALGGICEAQS